MFGERRPRCPATQFGELAERLAQIIELRSEVFTQLAGGPADVVAGLPKRTRRPADRTREPLGPEDHQTGDHQDQHLPPADVGEHYVVGVSVPGVTMSVT